MPFNKKDHFNPGEIKPRFKLVTPFSEEEVYQRLLDHVNSDDSVVGKRVYDQFYIDIPYQERHFWSPELRIIAEKDEYADHEDTIIRVTVGPQYTVWVLFIFIYSFLGVIALFGGMYGLSQLALGNKTIWVWCLPVTLLMIVGVYVIAKSGQRKGRDQTLHLVSVLYHALGQGKVVRIDSF
ncbi:MAG: hypothetical protein WDZ35_12940 [Crocinitomicaceae bacterium]